MSRRSKSIIVIMLFYVCGLLFGENIQIKVGIYQNPPKVFMDDEGNASGFWGDLTSYIAEKEGWTIEWVEGTWNECLDRLELNEIDMMVDVAYSEEREKLYLFSEETALMSWTTLYTRKEDKLQSILDLNGKKIGALSGSINLEGPDGFRQMINKFGLDTQIVQFDDYESAFLAMVDGKLDGCISNRYYGYKFEQEYDIIRTPVEFQPAQLFYAFSKHGENSEYLISRIDQVIRELKTDQKSIYYLFSDKYFGLVEQVEVFPLWILYVLYVVVLAILISIIFIKSLRFQVKQKTKELIYNNEELQKAYDKTDEMVKQWEATFNSITDVIMLIDNDHRILQINKAGCELAKKPRMALVGQKCYEIFHDTKLQPDYCPCREAMKTGKIGESEVHENGRYYLATAWPIYDYDGELKGFSHAIHDITEKRQAEKELENYRNNLEEIIKERTLELEVANDKLIKANDKLLEASRLKSQFLANMSHELRSPLNSIIGFTGIMLQGISGELNSEQEKQLGMVYESAKHLLGLINDILDLSKIEAGRIKIINDEFIVKDLIEMVRKMITPLVEEKKLELEVICDPMIPEHIIGDRNRIKQVLINLLSNAVKFTEKGVIKLSCQLSKSATEILFSVEDTGIGIKPENLKTIFDEFTQVESKRHSKPEGTGLGLAISQKMAHLMNGKLEVESTYREGSKFCFRIPANSESSQIMEAVEPESIDVSKNIILTVDDEKHSQEILKTYLTGAGYEVIQAYNEKQTMELARKYHPFAITLDIIIPGKDGWDILNELKKDKLTSDIPVICISTLDNREMGISLGAIEYLVKPINAEILIMELKRLEEQFTIENILIVDDSKADRKLLESYLQDYGKFDLTLVNSGKKCLNHLKELLPDLIILDLMMPEMDGFEVIARIKESEKYRDIPIIIVSGKELSSNEINYLNAMIDGIIRKGSFGKERILDDILSMIRKIEVKKKNNE